MSERVSEMNERGGPRNVQLSSEFLQKKKRKIRERRLSPILQGDSRGVKLRQLTGEGFQISLG